jgi:5-methylcytosine-specific restriction endonuclease McrA
LKGEASHLWKGGATKKNKLARSRARYREWREAVFLRDDYTCRRCNARSGQGIKVYLHAHHIEPFANNEDLRYDLSNGITLCDKCHHTKHNHNF